MEPVFQAFLLFADNIAQIMSKVMTCEQLQEALQRTKNN